MVSIDSLGDRATSKMVENELLDEALYVWFMQETSQGVPLSGAIFQKKALSLNKKINGDSSFTASKDWLSRWKDHHGIRQHTITGGILSGDVVAVERFKTDFQAFVEEENLLPSQIYNADETGLFYKMLSAKSLASKLDDKANGHKKGKNRVILLLCSNATESHKLTPILIGKSAKPRALKNVNFESLPVIYRHQKPAWMSADI